MDSYQLDAVESSGELPLCIVAGPGSGKTTVMIERLVFLQKQQASHTLEKKYLVLTFSKAAVNEMMERLGRYNQTKNVEVLTFHAFSLRLIATVWPLLGYSSSPSLVSNSVGRKVVKVQ